MPSPLWAASWGSSIRYLITFHSVFSRCLHSCSRRIARQPSERRRRLVPHRGLALLHGSWGTCEYSHLLEKIVAGAGEGNRTLDIQLGKPCSPVALACRRSPLPRASENPGAAATATRGGISDKQHISSTRRCQEQSEAQRLLTGYDGQNAIGRIATAGRRFSAFADDLAGERRIGTFGEFKAAFRAASDAHGAAHACRDGVCQRLFRGV
jgi:hypothetical protein